MAESYDSDNRNGTVPIEEEDVTSLNFKEVSNQDQTVYESLRGLIAEVFFTDETKDSSLFDRVKVSVADNGPAVRQAFANFSRDVLRWTRRGSPLRALLVISVGVNHMIFLIGSVFGKFADTKSIIGSLLVGTIALLALTGLFIFLLFFLAATLNAIIISLLVSLAAVGGFLAIFFACVTAVYIGALTVALFAISTATITAIVAVLITTGWIGFFCVVWVAARKSYGLAKQSVSASSSAISAFSNARRAHKD